MQFFFFLFGQQEAENSLEPELGWQIERTLWTITTTTETSYTGIIAILFRERQGESTNAASRAFECYIQWLKETGEAIISTGELLKRAINAFTEATLTVVPLKKIAWNRARKEYLREGQLTHKSSAEIMEFDREYQGFRDHNSLAYRTRMLPK